MVSVGMFVKSSYRMEFEWVGGVGMVYSMIYVVYIYNLLCYNDCFWYSQTSSQHHPGYSPSLLLCCGIQYNYSVHEYI